MDDVDRAAERQARINETASAHRKPVLAIKPQGTCHACEELVDDPKLFCNSECADEYEWMLRQRGRR